MISSAVMAVLTLIEQLLPLLGGTGQAVALIASIINALVKFMPLIVDEVSTVYQSVKNIIGALKEHPDTTEEQMAALTTLDKQVDDAWDAIEGQLDPDNPDDAPAASTIEGT